MSSPVSTTEAFDRYPVLDVVLRERHELVRQVREVDVPRGGTAEAQNDKEPLEVDCLDDPRDDVTDREGHYFMQCAGGERPAICRG